jgi:peroxiredoxin
MLNTGSKAPSFTLPNTKKEPVSLDSMKGKKVVLAFFPGAFTGVCTKEMCAFRDSLAAFNGMDAQVVGISVDAPFSNGGFAEKNGLTFPLLSDYTRSTIKAYDLVHEDFAGLTGYTASKRAVFVLDKEGMVRYAWVAPNPGTEPNYDEVKKAVEAIR